MTKAIGPARVGSKDQPWLKDVASWPSFPDMVTLFVSTSAIAAMDRMLSQAVPAQALHSK